MLDHLVYAAPDLEGAAWQLARALGVRPTPGGRHPGRGTRNELLGLGSGAYLEIIGPDGPAPGPGSPFGIDRLRAPALVAWAARAPGIDDRVRRARESGYDPGEVTAMWRELPTGGRLEWRLTPFPGEVSVVPFLIDWLESPHPSTTSAPGCRLVRFEGADPDPEAVGRRLAALEVELPVRRAERPGLVALIAGPAGTVELR